MKMIESQIRSKFQRANKDKSIYNTNYPVMVVDVFLPAKSKLQSATTFSVPAAVCTSVLWSCGLKSPEMPHSSHRYPNLLLCLILAYFLRAYKIFRTLIVILVFRKLEDECERTDQFLW